MKGVRIDAWLVDEGITESRARAQALVLAGKVTIDGKRVDKAGTAVPEGANVVVASDDGWASRGAHKLLGAIAAFPAFAAAIAGADALDIGASTGGFTDVLLRHGAGRVIAVDVGYGQLHERLRQDARVVVMDRTNIRLLEAGAQSELRVRKDLAYQVKDAEEQIRQLDQQRDALAKQIQFINRLSFLKQNSDQVGKLVVDQLMGKVDTGVLRTYIEEISVRGAAGTDRLNELVEMFDQSWATVSGAQDDPELGRIMEEMERLSMSSMTDIGANLDALSTPDPKNSESNRQS